MIHVLDFDDNIIDYIPNKNNYVTHANLVRNKEESSDTYDFIIDSDRAENMRERNRIIIQDRNGIYREYIIVNVTDDIDDLTTVQCNASYVEDLTTAKPYKPGGFKKFTTTQALDDITKDTGWERAKDTEYGGVRTSTWTSYQTRYAVLQQMCTTYDMELDFYIELSSNSVAHRYVSLKSKNSLFKGKEIKFGKDLLSMTRTVDITDIHTALYAIGPEDDKGNRRELVVTDDDAQAQFGLDNRYIWGIYEPESDDAEMTEARLKTLATTQLNKDKQAAVSYEITSTDIANLYPHEVINFGDTVRIKDTEFNPPLYVEAEVIGETYDPIANESVFVFGNVKEFKESELRKDLYDRLEDIRKKMNDNITNVNTIVSDVVADQLEYFERKIIKSDTPPENPVNDLLWYDTSNPDVAVLRRYWNGEWIAATPEDVEQLGGMTREQVLLNELNSTFSNLAIQHARLLSDVYEVINSEYLVDNTIKNSVQTKLDDTITVYQQIQTNLDSMTEETATIGKLMDTQALFLTYRQKLQTLYNAVENAQIAINERFKLLQSQYTQEKFNNAMQKVATVINGTFDEDTGQLIADIPNQDMLDDMKATIDQAMNDMSAENVKKMQELQEGITQTNQRITSTNEELSAGITSVTQRVEGLKVGGRNLLLNSANISKAIDYTYGNYNQYFSIQITPLHEFLKKGDFITISFDVQMERGEILRIYDDIQHWEYRFGKKEFTNIGTEKQRLTATFELIEPTREMDTWQLSFYNDNNGDRFTIEKIKIEKGNFATDWTPAPEDIEQQISLAQQEAEKAAKAYSDAQDNLKVIETKAYADGVVDEEEKRAIADAQAKLAQAKTYADQKAAEAKTHADNAVGTISTTVTTQSADIKILKDGIKLKADNTEVTKIYDQYLTPLQTQVNAQKATLDVLPSQIAAKVSQAQYDADINSVVGRLNTSETEQIQLSNQIADRVTLNEYQTTKEKIENLSVGTRNLLKDSLERSQASNSSQTFAFIRYYLTKPLEVGKKYTFECDFITEDPAQSGRTSMVAYTPDNGLIHQDIVDGKLKLTFTANVASTQFLVYKDVAGTSSYTLNVTVKNAMLVEGNTIGSYQQAPEDITQDVDTKLSQRDTLIEQNGREIALKASEQEFNASKKTLSRVLADLTINTTDGITLSYDENGAITSHVVGPNGIKLKGDKVDIKANSEFNVLVGNVNDKVGKNEIINRLNVSPEGLDINVNNVGIRGGDATNYISIRNNEMLSYGVFERSWAGEKDTAKLALGIKDGRIMVRNQNTGYRLYLTERGLSTMMDGFSDDTSGTLEFHSQRFNETSRGITMHSTYGAVALLSEKSRIYTRSDLTNNIESFSYGVYIRPYMNTRAGLNEFNFYVKDADSASGTDGAILFGEISKTAGLAGSGIRFKKNAARGYADMESIVYATDNLGNIGTGSFYADKLYGDWKAKRSNLYAMVNGEFRVTDFNGATGTNGSINYAPVRIGEINSYGSYANHSGSNVYFGVGVNELRITNNNHYNGGNIGYKPIRASDYLPGSLERFKRDIELWKGDALGEIRDNMTTYSYYLNDDDDERKKRKGLIIGDDYKTPDDFIDGDGVSLYNMITYSLRAIQQLDEQNQKLENKIKTLEGKYNE